MTKRECAIIMAVTGVCLLKGDDLKYFYEYTYEILGYPLFTHEIPEHADEIKEKAKEDFRLICATATDDLQPAPHGEWIERDGLRFDPVKMERMYVTAIECSRCHCGFIPDNGVNAKHKYHFCPSCGSRMEFQPER